MNIRSKIIALALVATMAINPIMAAVPQKQEITQAKSKFQTFKKDIKCMFSREGCNAEQKKRLMWEGAALIAAVLLLAGGGYYYYHSRQKEKKRTEQLKEEAEEDIKEAHKERAETQAKEEEVREKITRNLDMLVAPNATRAKKTNPSRTGELIQAFKEETKKTLDQIVKLETQRYLKGNLPEQESHDLLTLQNALEASVRTLIRRLGELIPKRKGDPEVLRRLEKFQ